MPPAWTTRRAKVSAPFLVQAVVTAHSTWGCIYRCVHTHADFEQRAPAHTCGIAWPPQRVARTREPPLLRIGGRHRVTVHKGGQPHHGLLDWQTPTLRMDMWHTLTGRIKVCQPEWRYPNVHMCDICVYVPFVFHTCFGKNTKYVYIYKEILFILLILIFNIYISLNSFEICIHF